MTPQMILSRRVQILPALFASALLTAPLARADLIISVASATVNPGTVNDVLDVSLFNNGPAAVAIGAFSFGVSVTDPDITFVGATTSTGTPYIFAGDSLFGPAIGTAAGQSLTASDVFDTIGSGAVVAAGGSVGLGHVLFDVAPNAAGGVFAVSLSAPESSLADPSSANIPITSLVNGQISIAAQGSVPEPPAIWAGFFALISVVLARRLSAAGTEQRNVSRYRRKPAE